MAIQHGVIGENVYYTHNPGDISKEVTAPFCPIADKTAVYGPYYKRYLINKGHYVPSSVVVTGQPRYDELAKTNLFNKEKICKEMTTKSTF